jgi:hypothetical protein
MVKKLADADLRFNVKARRMGEADRGLAPASAWSAVAKRRNSQLVSEALDHYDQKKKKAKDC